MKTHRSALLIAALAAIVALGGMLLEASTTVSIGIKLRDGAFTSYPVAASTKVLEGSFAALDGSNNLVAATDASARRVVGLFSAEVDNSSGSAGDLNATVAKGLFFVKNSGTNALTDAHIGRAAFIEDNETVASSGGTNYVVAGIVEDVTSDGVWLWVGLPGNSRVSPVSVSLTSTNGTAGAAADLAALKAEAEKIGDDVRAVHAAVVLHGLIK